MIVGMIIGTVIGACATVWLWSFRPWVRPPPAPELPDNSPRLFHIPAEADWPFGVTEGSLCIVEGNSKFLGGLYMFTGEMGWVQVNPGEHDDAV